MRNAHLEGPFVCECKRVFKTQSALRFHVTSICRAPKSNLKINCYLCILDHVCDICGAAFVSRGYIRFHMKTHGTKRPKAPYKSRHTICEPCGIDSISFKDFRGKHAKTRRHQKLVKNFFAPSAV